MYFLSSLCSLQENKRSKTATVCWMTTEQLVNWAGETGRTSARLCAAAKLWWIPALSEKCSVSRDRRRQCSWHQVSRMSFTVKEFALARGRRPHLCWGALPHSLCHTGRGSEQTGNTVTSVFPALKGTRRRDTRGRRRIVRKLGTYEKRKASFVKVRRTKVFLRL